MAKKNTPSKSKVKKNIKTSKVKPISIKVYDQLLMEIKEQIDQSQVEAITAINVSLNKRNWFIGKIISDKQKEHEWGSNFLEKLAKDLQDIAPGSEGFSTANIYRMKAFYEAYGEFRAAAREFENNPIFRIPWWHNVILLQRLKNNQERLWYAQKSIEYGWSRNMLEIWIKSNLYKREGKAITNFSKTLPSPHSDMAQQALKDPLILDFLALQKEHHEKELEQGLIDHIQKFLLELGEGFAFVARQKHLNVGKKDYYIDLLFFHIKLHCYVVIELKAGEFDPRDAGQINFYLSAVDDLIKLPEHKPTIGLVLCKSKNNFTAEYALRNLSSPIGIAGYETTFVEKLPKNLRGSLPTIEEIEAEFEKREVVNEKKLTKKRVKKNRN